MKELRAVWVTSWIIDGLLNTLINTILRDLRDDDDDWEDVKLLGVKFPILGFIDEKNWNPRNIILGALFGPISGVPLLGELASGFDSGPLSTTFRGLASLATLAEALVTLDIPDQHENEPYEWLEKHLVNVLNGVGIFFRSDIASAANIGDQIFKYADGLFDTKTEAGVKQLRKEAREKREAKEASETDAMRAAKEQKRRRNE